MEQETVVSETKTLFNINVDDISPNPHNPRLIFDADDLNELKKSLSKVGILVPLTVYNNKKNYPKSSYILLDGERRWRCAKELGLKTVPANIIDEPSDDTQNIMFMFNIHHFRKEWALFPTALKLEVVINKIGTDQESALSDFTGVSRSMIRRCKTLLWYPTKYRDVLMEKSAKISTDFFIELYPIAQRLSNEEEYTYPSGVEAFVDKMILKFLEQKTIFDVKEFREIRKSMGYFQDTNNFSKFKECIVRFFEEPETGLEVFVIPEQEESKERNNIIKYIGYLSASLSQANPNLISDYNFLDQLKNLDNVISKLIADIE